MRTHNFVFLDIETTGLSVIDTEIVEVGGIITTPDLEIIEEFEFKIKPNKLENADPVSLKISGYKEEEWIEAYEIKDALEILSEKIKNCIIVGHNVAFDFAFLDFNFLKYNIKNPLHYHKIDTISISWAKLHKEKELIHFSLRELCLRFDIENKKAHTALSDARATFELYKKLMSL
jgi:DNA polymerase III epsilon subunit family exonuclease